MTQASISVKQGNRGPLPPQRRDLARIEKYLAGVTPETTPTLLKGLSRSELAEFLFQCQIMTAPQGRELLVQGEPTLTAFLILTGRVEVSCTDVNGHRTLAHVIHPGEIIGEVEIFSGRPCAASCITMSESLVARFSATTLSKYLSPVALLRNFAKLFHDRLTRETRNQSIAMFYPIEDRVRAYLLKLTAPGNGRVQISQSSLASFTGCSRQTVNQILSDLRQQGLVELSRGAIRVLDRQALERAGPNKEAPRNSLN